MFLHFYGDIERDDWNSDLPSVFDTEEPLRRIPASGLLSNIQSDVEYFSRISSWSPPKKYTSSRADIICCSTGWMIIVNKYDGNKSRKFCTFQYLNLHMREKTSQLLLHSGTMHEEPATVGKYETDRYLTREGAQEYTASMYLEQMCNENHRCNK